jgi:hypothetical protein
MPAEANRTWKLAGSAVWCFALATFFLAVEYLPLGRERPGWYSRSGQPDESGFSVVLAVALYAYAAILAIIWMLRLTKNPAS